MGKIKSLKILTIGDKRLREKSKELDVNVLRTKDFRVFAQSMGITMVEKDGVGLAAPQVGKNIRLIVINTKDGVVAMHNPKIVKRSLAKEYGEEGCLSVPGIFGEVKRNQTIKCKYLDADGQIIHLDAQGLLARVIQHEIDHLDGILFIDKAKNIKKVALKD